MGIILAGLRVFTDRRADGNLLTFRRRRTHAVSVVDAGSRLCAAKDQLGPIVSGRQWSEQRSSKFCQMVIFHAARRRTYFPGGPAMVEHGL
jgi:hypothetical protein